ncbi:MAG: hypothetical protein ABJN65_11720 [Parasphingorhabdus sp.]
MRASVAIGLNTTLDVVFAKINIDLDDLTSRLGFDAVVDAYPSFREFFVEFGVSYGKIVSSTKNREDRNAIYDSISKVDLPKIAEEYQKLMAARPMAKWYAAKRFLGSVNGVILSIVAVLGMIFAGLAVPWEKYFDSSETEKPSQSKTPTT